MPSSASSLFRLFYAALRRGLPVAIVLLTALPASGAPVSKVPVSKAPVSEAGVARATVSETSSPSGSAAVHEGAFAPFPPSAPQQAIGDPEPNGRWSVWMGGAAGAGSLIGKIDDLRFSLLGIRYERRLVSGSSESGPVLSYTADFIPVAALVIPKEARPPRLLSNGVLLRLPALRTRGAGVAPVGLRLRFRSQARVQPFLSASAGVLYFDAPIPDRRGKQFNFTADGGFGAQVRLFDPLTLTVGYRYHHLSNGFRGEVNPGVDSHLITAGLTVAL